MNSEIPASTTSAPIAIAIALLPLRVLLPAEPVEGMLTTGADELVGVLTGGGGVGNCDNGFGVGDWADGFGVPDGTCGFGVELAATAAVGPPSSASARISAEIRSASAASRASN